MRPSTLVLLLAGIAASTGASAEMPAAASKVIPTLTIRVYAAQDIDLPVATTTTLVASLLAQAGIDTRWVACGVEAADTGCQQPLQSIELAIRLVRERSPLPESGPQPMGTSLIDTTSRTSSFATLFLNRIDVLARTSGTSSAVVFARALAHEAAHLVLGTNEHGATGLMRPLWTRDMLRREDDAAWSFTPDEGDRMRVALLDRLVYR